MTEFTPSPSQSIPSLREDSPIVAMDVRLGKRLNEGETLNFDYGEFRNGARELGGTDEEVDSLSIEVKDFRPRTLYEKAENIAKGGILGKYYIGSNHLDVVFNPNSTDDQVNETLFHEFQHYLDDVRGDEDLQTPVTEEHKKGVQRRFRLCMGVGTLAAAGVGIAFKDPAVGAMVEIASTGAAFGFSAKHAYETDPAEERANEAQSMPGKRVVYKS